jgi:sacsin
MCYALQVNTHLMSDMPCERAPAVAAALAGEDAAAPCVLWDIAEFADAVGAEALDITLDCRAHGQQSLLVPGLAGFQGPAICISIPGRPLLRPVTASCPALFSAAASCACRCRLSCFLCRCFS